MSSPDCDLVTRLAESIDHSSTAEASNRRDETLSPVEIYRARILRIDQDEARLAARGCTWYEIKASTLRQSEISVIRDKAGINDLYEVAIPHVRDRAHRPPPGFHSFYVNQIDRGLRFPIPKFITDLCDHLGVSPSQLTPNSFSSLLSLGILLKFFRVPLSTFTIMRLVQIKRLGPGKFYIANWCVSGNPSSHKGWMSRYFFVKRISSRENPWGCDMSWRDEARAQPPPTPERAPDLTDFIRVTREKCFMSKAEMLRALREKKADPEGASRSLGKGKRKITEEGGEKPKKRHHEKKTRESDRDKVSGETTKETPSSGGQNPEQQTNETSYEYLDASNISFVAKPSGSVSLDFTRRLISDQDYDLVNSVPDLAALEAASLHFMQFYINLIFPFIGSDVRPNHHLAEIRANNDKEKELMAFELEASRAEAQLSKARALRAEEENRALQAEVDRWKGEVENSWELGKEKFLQSKEFKFLCSGKALTFFEKGFDGCLAQFRESGYTEEEHPAPFLDMERALASMSDDEDAEEDGSGRKKTPPA
ncbi:hypothetical protein F511_29237 [Dorcoceras hygrometricum]|uniref:Uncharacterized protein n=1 Tax=Dorcoceras hygrometricum TaxID=472368 RepID=A0A2Z7BAE2_9LAMI|nr:hypothetical protein F511_29237 [Dorcoceras hygrometricum]